VGVFALGASFYMYSELSTPDAPPPAASVVTTAPAPIVARRPAPQSGNTVGFSSKPIGATSEGQLDPTLHMEAMLVTESLVYSGSGRNIFSANSAPTGIPKLVAKVRTEPIAPVRLVPTGPPPAPPIDLKFFGTETNAKGDRQAFLLHGEDVFLVASGEVVQRRYRIISIDARSIVIEDIANSNRQTLPLQVN
jgi:hypothetical protein